MEYLESDQSSSDERKDVNNLQSDNNKDSSHRDNHSYSNINSDRDSHRSNHSDNVYEESEQGGNLSEGRKKIKGFFKLKKGDSEDEKKEKERKNHDLKDGKETFKENINVSKKKKKKKKILILLIIIKNILIKINKMELHQTNIHHILMKIFLKQQKEIKY
ncbi:conserved Plasmodium protein, unknown function [Plasmodium sp. gorilla clade G3]|nr:conserved Plasmodium protein, unknown function [Plasmodium sp. gorilla clade G3]